MKHEWFEAQAYGRVNLIGEHTDYNDGWVLPTSIPYFTQTRLKLRNDHLVLLNSIPDRSYSYTLGYEHPTASWTDYLEGCTKILRDEFGETLHLTGFEAKITSSIPEGAGLSSSAALIVSFLKALREALKLCISDVELAVLARKVENEFVGAKVGIMDQMATCLARAGEALFLDTRSLEFERIPLPLEIMDLLIINSGLSHQLSQGDGGYNQRRKECEEAAFYLNVPKLRDISLADLQKKDLPLKLLKRAQHVVSENDRVQRAARALRDEDLTLLGKLFYESHVSMRDDYEVSIPAIDLLVELTSSHQEVYGARLTGGGFGGSIVAITRKGEAKKVAQEVLTQYQIKTPHRASVLVAGEG